MKRISKTEIKEMRSQSKKNSIMFAFTLPTVILYTIFFLVTMLIGVYYSFIAVGNAHGPYVKTPNLDLERIYAIRKKVNIPLVLHGCSDIPEEQMKEAVNLGMSKFNIATEYFRTMYQSIEKRINNQEFEGNGVKLMYDIKEEMIDFVIQKIRLLNPNKYSM